MKQVVGTFFVNTEENFDKFMEMFMSNGYEVAKQGEMPMGAVVIEEIPEEETEQTEEQ